MTTHFEVTTALPDNFQSEYFLAFHRRDKCAIAELVEGNTIKKGLVISALPCLLTITLEQKKAIASLHADGHLSGFDNNALLLLLNNMLGLLQPTAQFELAYQSHPDIAKLLRHSSGLRIPQTATPFEAIVWAITGQLISVEAAVSIRRRLIETSEIKHSSGLWCQPSPHHLAKLPISEYRKCGYSNAKAQTIQLVAQRVINGQLNLSPDVSPIDIDKALLAIKGVGPWTVSYTLLRGFGWLDGSLHGDVAVRKSLQRLLGSDEPLSQKQTQQWLSQFSPWKALVAAHLWAMESDKAY
ncbi:DNA-3-methyladenine glycosylase family protein [Enterovibrio nigricans]|uniref:DNA-3-methyladenine glycosylase II n=1 Tax=Enterovibrio nigricans DSM 22720 TaxID=1121868 RepID=A0A1T4VVV6_9GAMM|nr:DNA-3-methyladenine glycosylase [Enterovibrio nigricans]PKF49404.1 DNA-3-methyladenine glycosylase 2 family protein [Enterovibrio nigricans]SKA68621.1 DNA-3-methyladenine glycosylase II [Enterovibrio nigricans DSM 22720]